MKKKQIYRAKTKPTDKAPLKRFVLLGALILIGLITVSYAWYRGNHQTARSGVTADGETVNLEPATKDEKAQTDANKDAIVSDSDKAKSTTPAAGQMKQSTVVINPSATGVTAYVIGVFEEGGTCSAIATMGSQTSKGSSAGFQNASYTQCVPIEWDTPLSKGSWKVTVSYKSAITESSASKTIEVQ